MRTHPGPDMLRRDAFHRNRLPSSMLHSSFGTRAAFWDGRRLAVLPVSRACCPLRRLPYARHGTDRGGRRTEAEVEASGTTLTEIFGVGPILAAKIIGTVGSVARFPTKAHFASYSGTAPVEARGVEKENVTGGARIRALRGVDLSIPRGEMVAVMGLSGCEKTTHLNCLSGLDEFDGGDVFIGGESISGMSHRKRTRFRAGRMGFIFQTYNLIPVLSAVENVEVPLLVAGARPKEARGKALSALETVAAQPFGRCRSTWADGRFLPRAQWAGLILALRRRRT